jgi:hypothetical protein
MELLTQKQQNKLRGLSPPANYTDRATLTIVTMKRDINYLLLLSVWYTTFHTG